MEEQDGTIDVQEFESEFSEAIEVTFNDETHALNVPIHLLPGLANFIVDLG